MANREQPTVFIGIATGPVKDYAMHYMVAALRNLDWNNMEIHWSTTHFKNTESDTYLRRLKHLMHSVAWNCPWTIHMTYHDLTRLPMYFKELPDESEPTLCTYDLIVKNLRRLRGVFLDGDCDYFLEVGGDNPPPRNTIKRLMELDADVAFGTCYQRPSRDSQNASYPLVWEYSWTPNDLAPFNLEPELKKEINITFTHVPFTIPIMLAKNWRKRRYLSPCAAGTGMVLIKRHVLESVGWRMPPTLYFSEDMYFCHQCNAHGFKTVCDLHFHVPHFEEDGISY